MSKHLNINNMDLEKIELEKKYGHLGYHKDIDNSSNLYKIAIKKYENSVRYNLLEEIIDEIQHNDDVKSIIKDKYIKCMDNKKDLDVIENILLKK